MQTSQLSSTRLAFKSGAVPAAISQMSCPFVELQSTKGSHSSGCSLKLQSVLLPAARSHSSNTPLPLQSAPVPNATSQMSCTPLLLQSPSGSHSSG